ncbi:MAG TPA: BON domain-containing protein [Usitatibacter sp.]|jgi:hyperosmotically inducible periplasmic protein|nr:BON domain-containing protein [Usitatibacter sp.]
MDTRGTGLAVIAVACLAVAGCSKQADSQPQGSVGQKIDRAIDRTQEKLNAAGEKAERKIIEAGEKTQETISHAVSETKAAAGGITYSKPPTDTAAADAAKARADAANASAAAPAQGSHPAGTAAGTTAAGNAAAGTATSPSASGANGAPVTATSSGPKLSVETPAVKKSTLADAGITASIKADFLKDPDLSVLKIDVDTVDGVVTLNGLAGNAAARIRAERMAQAVKGVKEVRNFLTLKQA